MAIGSFYDINRDQFFGSQEQYHRHMEGLRYEQARQMQAQQAHMQDPRNIYGGAIAGGHHAEQQRQAAVVDTKDPLAFLKQADKNLLLTGEMQ